MALKDRDYMKRWGREDPYHNQLDLGPPSSERIVAAGVAEHRGRTRLGMRWPFQVLALVIVTATALALRRPALEVTKQQPAVDPWAVHRQVDACDALELA